jgi:Mce-associated membrane protein
MPPRRRTSTTPPRRPRVAGLAPVAPRVGGAERAVAPAVATETPQPSRVVLRPGAGVRETERPDADPVAPEDATTPVEAPSIPDAGTPAGHTPDDEVPDGEVPDGEVPDGDTPAPAPRAASLRSRAVPLLAAALVLLLGLAVVLAVADHSVRSSPAATNLALADVATTAEVAGQLGVALETVYSYDFARLDENERAAREVITPGFAAEFDTLFAQVRELAPQQQAVVSATVTMSAVQSIEGDRAVLVAFMDQQATRAAAPEGSQQLAAAGRLTVVGERVDGRWKIADVESR